MHTNIKVTSTAFSIKFVLYTLLLSIIFLSQNTGAQDEEIPLTAIGKFIPNVIGAGQNGQVQIDLELLRGYRAYSDQFKLVSSEQSQFKVSAIKISPLSSFFDENTKKTKIGVIGKSKITATFEAPENSENLVSPAKFILTYQACTKTYCLFPQKIEVSIPFEITASMAKPAATAFIDSQKSVAPFEGSKPIWKRSFADIVNKENIFIIFTFLFIAGFLTSLTPCVFPMIPITVAILGRQAHARTHFQTFLIAHIYILGIATSYSALGVLAASTGALFGSFMSSPWVLGFVCFVFLMMAISMFGYFEIQAPQWVQNKLNQQKGESKTQIFLTGIIAGLVASPCVGPVLVGLLTYVAQTQNLFFGFASLFVFALGMGQLFLILGLSSSATKLLPKSGPWMDGVKHFFAILMLAGFYYYLQLLVSNRFFMAALGIGLIAVASIQGAFTPNDQLSTTWLRLRKGLCQAIIFIGSGFLVTAIFNLDFNRPAIVENSGSILNPDSTKNWTTYSKENFDKAMRSGKPFIIDFYADWCAACHELDKYTFSKQEFIEATKDWTLLKFDATNESDELKNLKMQFNIVGLPTVLFFNTYGQLQKDLTLTEFEPLEAFLNRIKKLPQ